MGRGPHRSAQLIAAGWAIDAHSLTHADLALASGAALTREISGSRREIFRLLGVLPRFFCYPAGRYDADTLAYVRAASGETIPAGYEGHGGPLAQQTVMLRHSRRFGGPIGKRDSAELETVPLRGGSDCIPTLDRLLAQVAGRVPLLIEVKSKKSRNPIPLCLAVRRALEGYQGDVAVMSFDPRVPRWFAVHSPETVRGLVVTEENARGIGGRLKRHLALWHGRPDFIAYDIRDLPSRFAEAQRARGLPLLTWTVRSPELRERAANHADAPIAEGAGLSA